jgi:hypothetical protein
MRRRSDSFEKYEYGRKEPSVSDAVEKGQQKPHQGKVGLVTGGKKV